MTKEQLRPTRDIVKEAIGEFGSSAPGPDSVPFEVYKAMGETAVELFLETANAMLDGLVSPGDDFNLALMVCIPKCADGVSGDGQAYFEPSSTRPISVVDASNRILAPIFFLQDARERNWTSSRPCPERLLEAAANAQKCSGY